MRYISKLLNFNLLQSFGLHVNIVGSIILSAHCGVRDHVVKALDPRSRGLGPGFGSPSVGHCVIALVKL